MSLNTVPTTSSSSVLPLQVESIQKPAHNESSSLAERMKKATALLHREAEQNAIMQDMVKGTLSELKYIVYLNDNYEVYSCLETELSPLLDTHNLKFIEPYFRAKQFAADLGKMKNSAIKNTVVKKYQEHLIMLSKENPLGLLGHSYCLHLAPMYGGQIQKKALALKWPEACAFCDYPDSKNIRADAEDFKKKINALPLSTEQQEKIIAEAKKAFDFIIQMFRAEQGYAKGYEEAPAMLASKT